MKKLTCEIGDKFGEWEVIDNTPICKNSHVYIKVRCKCGKEDLKALSDLKSGRTKRCRSCGAKNRHPKIAEITVGKKYKNWTVLKNPKKINGFWKYEVQCECGYKRLMPTTELLNENSCFCCPQCAAEKRAEVLTKQRGRKGDLNLTRYSKLKKSAEKRGYAFEVSIEYLWNLFQKQHQICAITGDYIPSIKEASLDRINSSIGYIEGNVQWVTYQANVSKHVMSMEELYEFCKKVLNYANQQPSLGLTTEEGSETNS